jgi:hypothetical protein
MMQEIEAIMSRDHLGGPNWVDYATDLDLTVARFKRFAIMIADEPDMDERFRTLPPADVEPVIRGILLPEGWDAKQARFRRQMGS